MAYLHVLGKHSGTLPNCIAPPPPAAPVNIGAVGTPAVPLWWAMGFGGHSARVDGINQPVWAGWGGLPMIYGHPSLQATVCIWRIL